MLRKVWMEYSVVMCHDVIIKAANRLECLKEEIMEVKGFALDANGVAIRFWLVSEKEHGVESPVIQLHQQRDVSRKWAVEYDYQTHSHFARLINRPTSFNQLSHNVSSSVVTIPSSANAE